MSTIVPRETVYVALFTLMKATQISAAPAFVYTSRRLRTPDDITSLRQPAMLMQQLYEQVKRGSGTPPIHRWPLIFWLLFRPTDMLTPVASDVETYADTLINNYVDAFENQLEPPTLANAPGGFQTLGGLVKYARIEGQIDFDPGLTDNQAVIKIPVEVLATR